MALSVSTCWEVRSTGNSANGGGFNVANANFATDLAATSGTSTAPVVSSASYTFVAGDVGAMVFIKSGTNWIPGFYPIASVSAGAATLTASIGSLNLYGGATILNTAAGCATTASPTGGTFGVDYSQQTSPAFTFTDLVIDATTNTKFTSAAFPVGKNFVGNILNVTSGTGFTVQRVEIVSTTTTVATCDKSLGTTSSTGGNGKLGGCIDGLVTLTAAMVASNRAFLKGSFTQTATATFAQSAVFPTNAVTYSRITGYGTYRGDGVKATVTLGTNTGLTAISASNAGWLVENITVDGASLGTSRAILLNGLASTARACKALNCATTTGAIAIVGSLSSILGCEVAASASGVSLSAASYVMYCHIHDNTGPGISLQGQNNFCGRNLVVNNTGASTDGISVAQAGVAVFENTVYGSGRDGIRGSSSGTADGGMITSNLLAGNGGYGLTFASAAGTAAEAMWDGNAYWSNTSGTRNNVADLGSVNPINGVAPYVNSLDVILSADPFVLKASNDFRLNATAGGGAACRGFGVPTSWPGNSLTVGAPDMGAVQHVDSGGSGGPVRTNFRGGFSNG